MKTKLFLITPPFTQLNTPYPATAYIKGFLNTKNIESVQADLGIEVILKLFSKEGLLNLFKVSGLKFKVPNHTISDNSKRICALQDEYLKTIDPVIAFLQGKNPTLALQICQEDFLPEASRFAQLEELDWAFGTMGTQDKAKHLATLFLEDISDFIVECVDANFGFSRYAERLGRSANSFDELYEALQQEPTYIDNILLSILKERIETIQPTLFLISVPFPGNLYSAFRSAQWVKKYHPNIKISMGGGFPNTELRSLSDTRVFEFFDFITLDDGEMPIELLCNLVSNPPPLEGLGEVKRTFLLEDGKVVYKNNSLKQDYKQSQVGTPDYSDLLLDKYISVIEIVNPMHRMWSDGRWNKLTMAHGCYWGKCTFCDISLDYIKVYEPIAASLLCDRMEEMIAQTGENGFHFVDEAAPPALMRALALEILRRKLAVTWWTNIRFEKSFTKDLCLLLKASGCIAVSGGLEVASDRLLKLIDKGVTVEQVAKVTRNFTEAGVMVHAYLMYGYPTQTIHETVDSLEMVRQLFEVGVLQSGFWHQFAMTAHSPVGLYPEKFGVVKETEILGTFANNDINYTDSTGIDHDKFSFGLKKSLFNFMHGICFDYELQDWFEFKIPKTKISPDFIFDALQEDDDFNSKPTAKIVWLGGKPFIEHFTKSKKGNSWELMTLTFHDKKESFSIQTNKNEGEWLVEILQKISVSNAKIYTFQEIKIDFETQREDFELFWYSKPIKTLREFGLLVL
ncbi:B12-binding domain-containing radical SAM protein [Flavobacterium gawalongense]|uniref:Radical SAM protein n=1 Tax=Flavobacterium gawalongense TaxID=2594432 RepID=A0A553BVE4_9FLAO|nr:radical SAM protein [Flavobacterium gawalongense]TRX02849.1 radical SAM protein [Flavobacterium gawalongense]TRX08157.1 radical SAM protein [Flavobacterium gawalongense]TRX11411.1 radical SAM protein [Flavobacterium gawalongense]TRX12203.1 radical SAM protein [Flavobacterium gawalongense]TRX29068.1 radical SAM protein [Flavobacterium gawalongense]